MYFMTLGTVAAWYSKSNISRSFFLSCPDWRLSPGTARQSRGTRPIRTLSLAMSNSWMRSRMKRSVFSVSWVRASGGSEKTTSAGLDAPQPKIEKQILKKNYPYLPIKVKDISFFVNVPQWFIQFLTRNFWNLLEISSPTLVRWHWFWRGSCRCGCCGCGWCSGRVSHWNFKRVNAWNVWKISLGNCLKENQ